MSDGPSVGDASPHSPKHAVAKWLRRSAACLVLVLALGGLILDKFRICSTEATSDETLQLCRAPEISDASVIAVAVLFLILALPDFEEVTALGVSLRRRIEAVDRRADEIQASILTLTTQISQATASASIVNHIGYLDPDNSLDEIAARLATKLGRSEADSSSDSAASSDELTHGDARTSGENIAGAVGAEGTARALLAIRLIELWEELQERLLLGPRYRAVRESGGPTARFASMFAEEINTVRQARNSVAHAQRISTHDIELAVDAAEKLLEIARRKVAV